MLLITKQAMWSLEKESVPGEDVVKIAEMTTKNLDYYQNLLDKAAAGFGRTDSTLKVVLLW